jgi:NADPH:quinone reductase-like Zn-dependent oxidoreductase
MSGLVLEVPSKQIAIVGKEGGGLELNRSANVPDLEDDMLLVKNMAVAVNPVDTKMAAPHLVTPGTTAGHDYAGEVVAIGSNVWTAAPISVGDRVCGAVQVRLFSHISHQD